MLKNLTDAIVDDVLNSNRTFIILFCSDGMPNTPEVIEIFEKLDSKFSGKIDVYKCEIDKETGKINRYFQMLALPAMIMMKNKKVYANMANSYSETAYINAIKAGIVNIMQEQKQSDGYTSIG